MTNIETVEVSADAQKIYAAAEDHPELFSLHLQQIAQRLDMSLDRFLAGFRELMAKGLLAQGRIALPARGVH